MKKLLNALMLAIRFHRGQKRKGDGRPYLGHPMAVAFKLWRGGFSQVVMAAGLCHDLLEDTPCSECLIEEKCGGEVPRIVKAVTNDDTLPWEEKKTRYIESVKKGGVNAKAVAVADKIHNLECLLMDYKEQGPSLWGRFNRGYDKKLWFEKGMLAMLKETWVHPFVERYEELVKEFERLGQ